jgi:hypothetical protein
VHRWHGDVGGEEMATYRWQPRGGRWITGFLAGFLFALGPWLGDGANGEEPAASAARDGVLAQRPRITVQQGRLTVSLRGADVRTVVTEIGQLAGIPVMLGLIPERRVSAEFTDVALEEGLRRLLKLAALNHTILYAQGPAGKLVMKKVLVFGTEQGGMPRPPTAAEADREERPAEASQHLRQAAIPGDAASPAADNAASAVMTGLREALQRGREQRPHPRDGEESEAVRRVRAAIDRAIHAQAESPALPKTAEEIIGLIPGTLGGQHSFTAEPAASGTLWHPDASSAGEPPAP